MAPEAVTVKQHSWVIQLQLNDMLMHISSAIHLYMAAHEMQIKFCLHDSSKICVSGRKPLIYEVMNKRSEQWDDPYVQNPLLVR